MMRIWLLLSFLWLIALWFINVNGAFPLNDDWQYAYAVKNLVENGSLDYRGQFSPIVLVQVLWGALFCKITTGSFSFTVLRWSTILLTPFLVGAVFKLSEKLSLSKYALIILGIGLFTTPLLMVLAPSFMSDVPFAFLSITAVLFYWNYTQKQEKKWLIYALFFSLLAFYTRQPGMMLPIIFGIHYWWINGWQKKQLLVVFLSLIFAILLLLSWEILLKPDLGLTDNFKSDMTTYLQLMADSPFSFFKTLLLRMLKNFIYLGLFCLPLAPFIWPKKLSCFKIIVACLFSCFLVLTAQIAGKIFPFGGNIFYNFGLGPELLADTYTLGLDNTPKLSNWVMYLFHFLSASWAFILLFSLFDKWHSLKNTQRQYLQLWLILAVSYFPLMAITSYYDRYVLLPLLLLWPVLLIDIKFTKIKIWQWMPLVVFMFFSISATHDYFAWNRAKLTAFNWLQSKNISIKEMDAGYELNGWYNYGAERILNDSTSFWWVTDNEYLLTFGPVPDYENIHKIGYSRWLWNKDDFIYVLKKK